MAKYIVKRTSVYEQTLELDIPENNIIDCYVIERAIDRFKNVYVEAKNVEETYKIIRKD